MCLGLLGLEFSKCQVELFVFHSSGFQLQGTVCASFAYIVYGFGHSSGFQHRSRFRKFQRPFKPKDQKAREACRFYSLSTPLSKPQAPAPES